MSGVERISALFVELKERNQAAFMPYHPMGYPTRESTLEIVKTLAEGGADLFEIGIPHSDPLADGPTVQSATHKALTQGTTVVDCLAMIRELRHAGVMQPFCAMTYFNPLHRYGTARFVEDAREAGVDGLIIPDLPPEEAGELIDACRAAGLATIFLLAPTSTDERIRYVAQQTNGFVYLVSVTGTTGARTALPPGLDVFIKRVRRHTDLPLALGFGIGDGRQAAFVSTLVDGVIVGSALVKAAGDTGDLLAVRALAEDLAAGAHRSSLQSAD